MRNQPPGIRTDDGGDNKFEKGLEVAGGFGDITAEAAPPQLELRQIERVLTEPRRSHPVLVHLATPADYHEGLVSR